MPKMCAFSNRIYKNTLNDLTINELSNTLKTFNKMKHRAYKLSYNLKYKKHKYNKSIQLLLKDNFNISSDYYINSARKEAESNLRSQIEKKTLDINSLKNQIKTREKKIKSTKKALDNKLKVKDSLIKISKAIKENKKLPTFKTYKGAREYLLDSETLTFAVRRNNKEDLIFNIYTFEQNEKRNPLL